MARSALKPCERCNRQDELHTICTGGHLNAVAVQVSMMLMEGMQLQGVVRGFKQTTGKGRRHLHKNQPHSRQR